MFTDCVFIACFMAALTALTMPMQKGIASVYNIPGHVACGGHFNPTALTAAHRTLPCGTKVRVWRDERHVDVRINDRGPATWTHRVIDLTPAAAKALGIDGLGEVVLEIVH